MRTLKRITISALIFLAGVFLTLLPAEFWFFIYRVVGPVGFWEKALIVGGGVWICGGLQIVFLALGGTFTLMVMDEYWESSRNRKGLR